MADGDPMVLETRYGAPLGQTSNYQSLLVNGPMELWLNTAEPPIGWDFAKEADVASVTHLRVAGTRTSGYGSYIWRLTFSVEGIETLGKLEQIVALRGNNALPARGHDGRTFTFTIWGRATANPVSIQLYIETIDADGTPLNNMTASAIAMTGTWTQYTVSHTISADQTVALRAAAIFHNTAGGGIVVELDEAEVYTSYTFAVNPSMPDAQGIFDPTRKYGRTTGGYLYTANGPAGAAKHQKTLNFGLIGIAQFNALRSLWLLGSPCRWTPNQPHLPANLDVRLTDDQFNFSAGRGSFASNIYRGSLELSEI